MEAQFLDSLGALCAVEREWRALYEATPDAAPFQHPDWLLPWWQAFGSGSVFSFAAWDESRLVALLPAFLHNWEGRRQVTLLGTGVSDRLGLLAAPGHSDAGLRSILDALAQHASQWDRCSFEELSSDSELIWEHSDLRAKKASHCTCASRVLPRSSQDLHGSLPPGLRRNLRRYVDKLHAAGNVEFRSAATEGEFQSYIKALFHLHACRWNQRGQAGMLSGALQLFHREAALRLWRAGKARCFAVLVNGAPIAAIYGFCDKQRFFGYQSGFDPGLARYSPGSLILNFAMEQAISEGDKVFDFLRGDEPYKRDWGAEFACNGRVILWHTEEHTAA